MCEVIIDDKVVLFLFQVLNENYWVPIFIVQLKPDGYLFVWLFGFS